MRKQVALALLLTSALQMSCSRHAGNATAVGANAVADGRLLNAADAPNEWVTHGGTYKEQRYSALDAINAGNVGGLKLAWYADLDTNRGQEATPLVVDGVLYTTTAWSKVVAVDAATGRKLWDYDPKVPPEAGFKGCCDVVNRGAAYYDGKIFFGTFDGRLIALDAKTGALVWSTVTTDPAKFYTITGAPRVVRGKVIIGNGGAEFGVRGYVSAYDARTGKQVWRFYTVPGDPALGPDGAASDDVLKEKASSTWHGKFWAAGGGGTVWDSIVYDQELNQLYIGVGNGSPWNHKIRSEGRGDNLFLSSIVALNPDTGKYIWHYQETPGESWDFTATQQMVLGDLKIDGHDRKVLMQAPKNGFFYVLDRTSGKLLSAKNYGDVNWATHIDMATGRPVETPNARYAKEAFFNLPGGTGAHNWQPMAFSPKTGLMYIPVQRMGVQYTNDTGYRYNKDGTNLGVSMVPKGLPDDLASRRAMEKAMAGWLVAWDPVAQKAAWRVPHARAWNGGALATSGNLVFQGTGDAKFLAMDAATGKILWSFDTQAGVLGGPIAYSVGGREYVAVLAGYGGSAVAYGAFEGPRPQPYGRVLVFSLDGKASLPAFEPVVAAPQRPTDSWSAESVTRGETLFANNCARCHGVATYSSGVLPDLRRSGALIDRQLWHDIVLGGALQGAGMISFKRYLKTGEVEDIRGYVASKARKLKPSE